MKKALIIVLIAIFTAGPVLADGAYRSKPSSESDTKCVACGIGHGLAWIIKLPFRLVTATTVGLYELVTDQDLEGFEDGYYLI